MKGRRLYCSTLPERFLVGAMSCKDLPISPTGSTPIRYNQYIRYERVQYERVKKEGAV